LLENYEDDDYDEYRVNTYSYYVWSPTEKKVSDILYLSKLSTINRVSNQTNSSMVTNTLDKHGLNLLCSQ
jgi:hypothetical protein